MKARWSSLSTGKKVLVIAGVYFIGLVAFGLIFGSDGKNETFKPQDEFRLEPWVEITIFGIDMSINKAVLYLALASAVTIGGMIWIARRMTQKPNLVQTTVELAYNLIQGQITEDNLDEQRAQRWFPVLATLFFFILVSNLIGLIPLPTNTEHPVNIFGVEIPTFALYAATANISIPLVLTLIVWTSYNVEGIREHGFFKYFGTWLPAGLEEMPFAFKAFVWVIEAISNIVRLVSLSVRLFANILAGHLLLLFMGGGLAVLLGLTALGWLTLPAAFAFFVFEIGIVAGLQAFIFTILTAIYIGGATAESH
jgi:F-type H+-transporting ATPase subunit a